MFVDDMILYTEKPNYFIEKLLEGGGGKGEK
jgi:hypothetical protein